MVEVMAKWYGYEHRDHFVDGDIGLETNIRSKTLPHT